MKLHHRVLLTLAACASVGLTLADVEWNYTSNTTFNYSTTDNGDGTTTVNAPEIPTEGNIIKTGAGTVIFDLGKSATGAECDAVKSTFSGDVVIEEGAIQIGTADGSTGTAWRVSPDVLGSEGTISVKEGATLKLQITQNGSVTFNKAISLDGGLLEIGDGNYTFAKPLTLTQDATIQNDWNKSHTFNGINAEDKTLTITRGSGGGTTMTFKGDVNVGKIVAGNGVNLVFNRSNGLTSLNIGTGITMGSDSNLNLHVTQSGTTALGEVTLGANTTMTSIDGNYTMTKLTLNTAATLKHHWGKTFTINSLQGEGATLNVVAGVEGEKNSAWVNIGGGDGELKSKLGTLDIQSGNVKITSSQNQIGTINVAEGSVLLVGGAGIVLNAETINLAAGSKLRLDNGSAYHPTMGSDSSVINVNGTADKAVVIAAGVYGQMTLASDIVGTGKLTLRRSETNYQNNVNLSGVLSGDMEITHESGQYTLNSTNTYSGGTIIKTAMSNEHKVTANANGALGTGDVTLVSTGKLIVNAGKMQTNTVKFMSDDTTSAATLSGASWEGTTLTGTTATGGSITGGTLAVTGSFTATDTSMTGVTLDIAAGGTLTMTGTNTLDGTSSVTVASGGTLDLSGVTFTDGVLEVQNLTLADGATLTGVDKVKVNGTLDLSNVKTLNFSVLELASDATIIMGNQPVTLSGTLTMGDHVTIDLSAWCSIMGENGTTVFKPFMDIMQYGDASSLTFDEKLEDVRVTIVLADYTDDDGFMVIANNGKTLQLVPEPTTATLSLLALAGLAARRRRK